MAMLERWRDKQLSLLLSMGDRLWSMRCGIAHGEFSQIYDFDVLVYKQPSQLQGREKTMAY